jgi:hypothetical protein
LANNLYEFVSAISGQNDVMTEKMRRRQESEQPPTGIEIMVTVCDATRRYPSLAHVKADASLDQVMKARRSRTHVDHGDLNKFPPFAAAYSFRDEAGNAVSSMDGISRVFAHYLPSVVQAPAPVISQPAAGGKVSVLLVYRHLDPSSKCIHDIQSGAELDASEVWSV